MRRMSITCQRRRSSFARRHGNQIKSLHVWEHTPALMRWKEPAQKKCPLPLQICLCSFDFFPAPKEDPIPPLGAFSRIIFESAATRGAAPIFFAVVGASDGERTLFRGRPQRQKSGSVLFDGDRALEMFWPRAQRLSSS